MAVEAVVFGLGCRGHPVGPGGGPGPGLPGGHDAGRGGPGAGGRSGGLPLGGVFLGQADGPLLGVARLGGPGALSLVVWTGGVALGLAALAGVRARRGRVAAGLAGRRRRGRWSLGLVALAVVADTPPTAAPRWAG